MISFQNVGKQFDETTVLKDVSFSVAKNEFFALVGPSGSGKSTLLKLLLGLVARDRGELTLDNTSIDEVDILVHRRGTGYMMQDGGLFPHWDVAKNVGLQLRLNGWEKDREHSAVKETLEVVGLPMETFGNRYPHALSGGQKQRVALARAIAGKPPLLLLDEPFSALDSITKRELYALFKDLRSHYALTSLMITHDLKEAFALNDRVGLLREGQLLQVGTQTDFVEHPSSPFVQQFIHSQLA